MPPKLYPAPIPSPTDSSPPLQQLNVWVIGPVGAGKSTIINRLTNNEANLTVGDGVKPCTVEVAFTSIEYEGRKITFFDTPGFNPTGTGAVEHLKKLMEGLEQTYNSAGIQPHVHGMIYVHDMNDKALPFANTILRAIEQFLGDHLFENLIFVTNMWDPNPKERHIRIEEELLSKDEYFGMAIKKGARGGTPYRICEGETCAKVQEVLLDLVLTSATQNLRLGCYQIGTVNVPKPQQESLNILVFGPTGSGKSTIINHLTNDSANLPIGDSLESCTDRVIPATIEHKGRTITFYDTPGFNDSSKTPADHLATIMVSLDDISKKWESKPHIHGVLYVHCITDTRMTKGSKLNLALFRSILGKEAFENVVLVTNMWARDDPALSRHIRLETDFIKHYFAELAEEGARTGPDYRIYDGATRAQVQEALLDSFLQRKPDILQAQKEMAEDKPISNCEVGKVLRQGLLEQISGWEDELGIAKGELLMIADGDARRIQIEKRIKLLEGDLDTARKQNEQLDMTIRLIKAMSYSAVVAGVVLSGGAFLAIPLELLTMGTAVEMGLTGLLTTVAGGGLAAISGVMSKLGDRWRRFYARD